MNSSNLQVVDPKLAAGRGVEFSAAYRRAQEDELLELAALDGHDMRLPLDQRIEDSIDWTVTERITVNDPIPAHNVGYRLLMRMGWVGGGLGREGHGRVDPIPLLAGDNGIRAGLGRGEVDTQYTTVATRKALEVEIQADEDEVRQQRREAEAIRTQKIKEGVDEILKTFYCEICHKQYQMAMQMEEHLSSYDHHHRKRMAETRAMMSARGRKDREKKSKRQLEKELAKLTSQSASVSRAMGLDSEAQPPLPPESPGTAPPLPPESEALPPLPPNDVSGMKHGGVASNEEPKRHEAHMRWDSLTPCPPLPPPLPPERGEPRTDASPLPVPASIPEKHSAPASLGFSLGKAGALGHRSTGKGRPLNKGRISSVFGPASDSDSDNAM